MPHPLLSILLFNAFCLVVVKELKRASEKKRRLETARDGDGAKRIGHKTDVELDSNIPHKEQKSVPFIENLCKDVDM